jgi:hypothetical protein
MTDRKFTPPTKFPAEYVDGYGSKVTILGRSNDKERPLVGFDDEGYACNYAESGAYYPDDEGEDDLHDIPKRTTPMNYRKKPIVIEAIQWTGSNLKYVIEFLGGESWMNGRDLIIKTLEGELHASVGDFIIRGVAGEFYPCKPDIFEKTYEPVEETE